jgi:hypothetical protein
MFEAAQLASVSASGGSFRRPGCQNATKVKSGRLSGFNFQNKRLRMTRAAIHVYIAALD